MSNLQPFILLDYILSIVLLLPIKDNRGPYKSFPRMTLILIGLNVGVHLVMTYVLPALYGAQTTASIESKLMLYPALVTKGYAGWPAALAMITSGFLHASWMHLLGNMFYLFFFGRKVEDVLGATRFGLLYMVCLFVSQVGSVISEVALLVTQGVIPNLGASGAIMGIVGAYLFLYHDEKIRTLPLLFGVIPIPILPRFSAAVFILYTIFRDVLNGWLEQQMQNLGYIYSFVNSFAHLGGLIAGLLGMYLFLPAAVLNYQYRSSEKRKERELTAN